MTIVAGARKWFGESCRLKTSNLQPGFLVWHSKGWGRLNYLGVRECFVREMEGWKEEEISRFVCCGNPR